MDEFNIQDDDKTQEIFDITYDTSNVNKMIENRNFIQTTLFNNETFTVDQTTPFKIHLYQDSMILKDLFL